MSDEPRMAEWISVDDQDQVILTARSREGAPVWTSTFTLFPGAAPLVADLLQRWVLDVLHEPTPPSLAKRAYAEGRLKVVLKDSKGKKMGTFSPHQHPDQVSNQVASWAHRFWTTWGNTCWIGPLVQFSQEDPKIQAALDFVPEEPALLEQLKDPKFPALVLAFLHATMTPGTREYNPRRSYSIQVARSINRHPNLPTRILQEALLRGAISAWLNPATPMVLVASPSQMLEDGLLQAFRYARAEPELLRELEALYPQQAEAATREEAYFWTSRMTKEPHL
jgi:hypothetical protein